MDQTKQRLKGNTLTHLIMLNKEAQAVKLNGFSWRFGDTVAAWWEVGGYGGWVVYYFVIGKIIFSFPTYKDR